METKKGGFKKKLDSFHQTSWSFVGISTVVCGSFWRVEQIQNGGRCHGNQGAWLWYKFRWNGVFLVTTMLTDLNIKPTIGNNFDEFLSSDQFVAWELQDTIKIVDLPESRHNSICDTATMNYMWEAKRRRVRHESGPSFIRKTYSIGDTVVWEFTK